MKRAFRGRLTVLAGVLAGAAIVVGLGVGFRKQLLELWYVHRLERVPVQEAKEISQRLGAMGSARAIPLLLERYLSSGEATAAKKDLQLALERAVPGGERFLVAALRSADPEDVETARIAFDSLSVDRRWLIAVYRAGLLHEDESLRLRSAGALRHAGDGATEALQELILAVDDSSTPVRLEAIRALQQLGTKAASARPRLTRAAQDPSPEVRRAAAAALAAN